MKKYLAVLCMALLALTFSGCGNETVSSDKPKVYTSFYALYDFAQEIAKDNADIVNMVPAGTEPHDWEPSANDMASLNDADLVLYVGMGMESWIDKVMNSLDSSSAVFVKTSENVTVYDEADPHIWLDPGNVKIMCENILNALCTADPENSDAYRANYSNYMTQLDKLDKSYETQLAPYKGKSIVVSHNAFGYLCNAYGISQVPLEGFSAESEPSPDRMLELVNFVKENNIKYIFCEELISPKTAQTLADETGAELLYLNPFEGLTDEEISAGKNYISVMYTNLENIKKALS